MSVDASSLSPAIMGVETAVEGVSEAIAAASGELTSRIDVMAESIGTAMQACCQQWHDSGMADITIPGCPEVQDAEGNVIQEATPDRTITTQTWAETQLLQQEMSVGAYNAAYNQYADQVESYRESILIPQVLALIAQLAILTKMYQCWNEMTEDRVKPAVQRIMDQFHPKVVADFCDNVDGVLSNKMLEIAGGFSDRNQSVDEACDWNLTLRDDLWRCYVLAGNPDDPEIPEDASGAGYSRVEKRHVQNFAQHLANLCLDSSECGKDVRRMANELYQKNEESFSNFEVENIAELGDEISTLYAKASDICAALNACGQMLSDCYEDELFPAIKELLLPQIQNATACLDELQQAITDARECMDTMKELYQKYLTEEEKFGPELISQANALAQCGDLYKECWQFATEWADKLIDRYDATYAQNEDLLIPKVFDLACRMAAQEAEVVYDFARDYADDCLDYWSGAYQPCDEELAAVIFEQAKQLYATRKASFDTLCEMSEKYYDHWCTVYQPHDTAYTNELMDHATALVAEHDEELRRFCEEAKEHLQWWQDCYKDAECAVVPHVIRAGIHSSDQKADTYTTLDEFMDHLLMKWDDKFCPCDLEDLGKACDVYAKVDPWCEIVEQNECMDDLGVELKKCAEEFKTWEVAYLQELCDEERYEPDYCPVEDRSVLHTRSEFGMAQENALRCARRYNTGATDYRLERLEIERIKAEANAMEVAHRFERWWTEQQNMRRHGRKLNAMEVLRSFRTDGALALQQSTQGNDLLLQRIHDRILRGYNYLSLGHTMGATSTTGTAQATDDALQGVDLGHFYPRLHSDMKARYQSTADSLIGRGGAHLGQGQFFPTIAERAKVEADQIASNAGVHGLQTMAHGAGFKDRALNANAQAQRSAEAGIDSGFNAIDRGHRNVDMALQWHRAGLDTVNSAFQQALSAIDRGHDAMRMALAFEQQRDNMAQRCRDNGMGAAAHGLETMQVGLRKQEVALQTAMQAIKDAMQLMNMGMSRDGQAVGACNALASLLPATSNAFGNLVGRGHTLASMAFDRNRAITSCNQAQVQMACEALQRWHNSAASNIYGAQGTLSVASGLGNSFGQGVGNSLEGALGSLTALVASPESLNLPPPAPSVGVTIPSAPFGGG